MKKKLPFALLCLLIQGSILAVCYYLYAHDFGYRSAELTGDEAIYFFSKAIGIGGIAGLICAFLGMTQTIYYQKWWAALLKISLIFLPSMALSVYWTYGWLFVKAYV